MVRSTRILAAIALLGTTFGLTAAPADAAPATATATQSGTVCPTGWGSLPETRTAATSHPVRNVRAGRHTCWDRLVVDVPGVKAGGLGYSVRYVDRLHQDGSGRVIPVSGGAVLEVRVTVPAYDPATGGPAYPGRAGDPLPGVGLAGYRTFRDARFAGSFEGDTQIGLGVRARLPFRVLTLDGHVVVDVAHTW
ncbi:hypothetical protein ABZ202_06390 [Streptomyces sp. NPDC006186]|uniref:AMIN-like domain-containing (lipo)protein n=1 Tax=Streptomyces sp. NPDC006186 TaxID=3155248 RepID=UPI00339FCAE6